MMGQVSVFKIGTWMNPFSKSKCLGSSVIRSLYLRLVKVCIKKWSRMRASRGLSERSTSRIIRSSLADSAMVSPRASGL